MGGKRCKERIVLFLHSEDERRKERKRWPREKQTSESETNLEDGSFSFCYLGRIGCVSMLQQKDCNEAVGSSSEKEQMDGGDSTKVETAKRTRQD